MTPSLRCPQCNQLVTGVGRFWVCPEHGPVGPQAGPATAAVPTEHPKLFISYGRRDARELADRLAVDLASNGFEVWQDTRQIVTGTSWQHEIVDGLRSAQVVVALMTPHSVRTTGSPADPDNVDSICLGEISYALFNPPPRPVVPVMVRSCEPPLAIFHLDYVDLRAWSDSPEQYQAGFHRLLAGIQAALRGEKRYRRWHHQLDPFDFAAFLHGKRRDFTGRQWLFDRIDAWRAACQRERALLITGDPGTGKSAIVAELVHRNPGGQVLAYHCCQWDVADTLKASRFVRSIAAMIAGKLEGYAALLEDPAVQEALSQSQCESDPGSALEKGIVSKLPPTSPRGLVWMASRSTQSITSRWATGSPNAAARASSTRPIASGATIVWQTCAGPSIATARATYPAMRCATCLRIC